MRSIGVALLALAVVAMASDRQPWGARLKPEQLSEARGYLRDNWTYHVTLRWRCSDPAPVIALGKAPHPAERRLAELRQAGFAWSLVFADGTPVARGEGRRDLPSASYDGTYCRLEVADEVVRVAGDHARLEVSIDSLPPALEGKKPFLMLERDSLEAKYDEPLESIRHAEE